MDKCRLCYTDPKPQECRHIFNTKFEPPIWKIIEQLSNLIIRKNDPYTKNICGPCFNKLEEYSAFRRTILDTNFDYFEVHCPPTSSHYNAVMIKEEKMDIEEHPLETDDTGYQELLNVNIFDNIIKEEHSENIMSKMKVARKSKKNSTAAKKKIIEKFDDDVFKVPSISETTSSGLIDTMEAGGSSNVTLTEQTTSSSNACQNCKECFCKFWRNELTADYVQGMEKQLYYMKNFFIMRNSSPTLFDTVKMELHPGTNVLVEKKRILIAIAKANSNKRAMVRNLLKECISVPELLKLKTAQRLCDIKPEIYIAITEYLNTNHNVSINSTLFKNVVNSYIGRMRIEQRLTPQEREDIKMKKRSQMRIKRLQKKAEL